MRKSDVIEAPPAGNAYDGVGLTTTRREFVAATLAMAIGGTAVADITKANRTPVSAAAIVNLNAVDLSRAIHARTVSCADVMSAFLDQIDRFNDQVNAIVSLQSRGALIEQANIRDGQLVRGHSLGWMHGFPHAVKDLAATKGIRTTGGSPLVDHVPDEDSILVERLKACGAIIIGKTNVPEFGLGSQSYNSIFGTTLNAYDQSRVAGGSSGGAAVSLALRMVPVADGSDMMGSLRNPAAFNNVFGFRPSFGRVPAKGGELFLDQLGYWGAMGRSVGDITMLMSTIAGPDSRDPLSIEQEPKMFAGGLATSLKGARLGWLGDLNGYLPFEPGILDLCKSSFPALQGLGCTVHDIALGYPPEKLWNAWLRLRHWLIGGELEAYYSDPAKRALMKPEAQWEVEGAHRLSALDAYAASEDRSDWYRAAAKLFDRVDFLLLPSAQVFPFSATEHWPTSINGVAMDTYHRWMEVVVPASLLGCPVLNVPVGFGPCGLPMGMQIIGPHHADRRVLELGFAYEQATHWVRDHVPSLLNAGAARGH
jgi:amidase